MCPEEMKLTQMEVERSAVARMPKEWVIDPSFLTRFKPDIFTRIVRLRMQHLSERAKLEAQILTSEAEMFEDIARTLEKQ